MKQAKIREFVRAVIKENKQLDSAQILSQYAHRDQKRRSGEPYFLHPQEVADIVSGYYSDTTTYYTALLHDALEDGIPLGNIEDESHFFDLLAEELPESEIELADEIYSSVQTLTKHKAQEYVSYVDSITSDLHAFRVKLADMMQNISDNPSNNQLKKYVKAKNFLVKKFNDQSPPGISSNHWRDFKQVINDAKEK
jgi:(p)ppGpp synthase/HD superfamily hydrolase